MATLSSFDLHDHSGLRWITWFGAAFLITVLSAAMMLLYPHLLG